MYSALPSPQKHDEDSDKKSFFERIEVKKQIDHLNI